LENNRILKEKLLNKENELLKVTEKFNEDKNNYESAEKEKVLINTKLIEIIYSIIK